MGTNGHIDPFILALPKAELHLHLEGAIDPETVVELARNHGETLDAEEIRKLYHYTDFTGFLLCFRAITRHLQTPDDYELITYRLAERLARENIIYAEVFIAVGTCLWWGRQFEPIFEGLERGRLRAQRDLGVEIAWIFDAVRHFGPEAVMCVAEHAVNLRDRGSVIAFGIGGDERRAGPELFGDVYKYLREAGMRRTCHAGETVGPQSIWNALDLLDTERIGHGLTAIQDGRLVDRLRESQVPVEINITSNVRTGCIVRVEDHPVRRLWNAGVFITLNTDDPSMFETTLAREYQIARDVFGFTNAELKQAAMNAFRASFLPKDRKAEYLRRFEAV